MSENTKPFVVRMSPELHTQLKEAAAADERSMAQAMRYAIRLYVEEVSGLLRTVKP